MKKRKFTKPALQVFELIAFLEGKGLILGDRIFAERCLKYIGYYRLKIYTRPFEDRHKRFISGSSFEDIVDLYNFDRRLRLHCLDAIERIEVALRSHIINIVGITGGPHFYYDEKFFQNKGAVTKIRRRAELGRHLSIAHYKNQYDAPHLPPIWCIMEACTFGDLSHWYADLDITYRKKIASGFGFHETICVSWFRSLATLRNVCAHHGRLWNADLHVDKPIKAKRWAADLQENTKPYSRFVVLAALLDEIDPGANHGWRPRMIDLINDRPPFVQLSAMGFPDDWREREVWQ